MVAMHIGHVALGVKDLRAVAEHYQRALALRETEHQLGEVRLSSNEKAYELQLLQAPNGPYLDHIGLEVESEADLAAVRDRALRWGAVMIENDTEAGLTSSVRFEGPSGTIYEVYTGMLRQPLGVSTYFGNGIRRLGHLTLFAQDPRALASFWIEVLGFRVSDEAEGVTWLRCDPDHHGLAVGPGSADVLHHTAWEVQDMSALAKYCDRLAVNGMSLYWGPVRHGPGFNLATYQPDPTGAVLEVYADMLKIYDETAYDPVDWSQVRNALNLWGPPPPPELMAAGIPTAPHTDSLGNPG